MTCKDCKTINECRWAFGSFWPHKSRSGNGCKHHFSPDIELFAKAMAKATMRTTVKIDTVTQTEIEF